MSKCQRSNTDDNTGLIIAVGHQTFTGQCKNWALDWTGLWTDARVYVCRLLVNCAHARALWHVRNNNNNYYC